MFRTLVKNSHIHFMSNLNYVDPFVYRQIGIKIGLVVFEGGNGREGGEGTKDDAAGRCCTIFYAH